MQQELFSTAQIAADLEHKSKNPTRDVLNIAKRLGFAPVREQTRSHNGKTAGGRPEKLWSREQRDAILADNHNRHKKPAQILSSADEPHDDVTPEQPDVAVDTPVDANVAPVVAEPVSVVEVVTLADRANRIRNLQADVQRGIIEIGNELIAAKEEVGHGNWSAWLETEFDWSDRTARRFMAVAERFGKMDNVVRFQPSVLQAMLALPEGDEQEFIAAQANQGTPVEKQSAREVQRNVKQWKQHKADSAPAVTLQHDNEPHDAPLDLSNKGETFSIFGRQPDSEPEPAAEPLPAQMDEHNPDITNVVTTARAFITETDDIHTLNVLRDSLAETLALLDDKINDLAEKN